MLVNPLHLWTLSLTSNKHLIWHVRNWANILHSFSSHSLPHLSWQQLHPSIGNSTFGIDLNTDHDCLLPLSLLHCGPTIITSHQDYCNSSLTAPLPLPLCPTICFQQSSQGDSVKTQVDHEPSNGSNFIQCRWQSPYNAPTRSLLHLWPLSHWPPLVQPWWTPCCSFNAPAALWSQMACTCCFLHLEWLSPKYLHGLLIPQRNSHLLKCVLLWPPCL